MWGKCKVCAEKDQRIADLKSFIETLTPHDTGSVIPLVTMEANKILSGDQDISSLTDENALDLIDVERERAAVQSERDRLLSGNY